MVSRKINPSKVIVPQQRHELLLVADAVAREKNIDKDEVLSALEAAILKSAKAKYGQESNIIVSIDRSTGAFTICRSRFVVEEVVDEENELSLYQAVLIDPNASIDDEIIDELPPVEFGRMMAQSARQIIVQKVREAERTHIYQEFKDRVGEIVSGLVKRVDIGNIVLDLGRGEGALRKEDLIARENFRVGDRVRVLITEIRPDAKGPMIITSRVHSHFMAKLFEQEIPEVYDGVIEIKSVSRDPGSRAKVAVHTDDASIDPVGSCVGVRGSRIQSISNEFGGEKVDIVMWSEDPATFIVNALSPSDVVRVMMDEETKRVTVVVPQTHLSLAIGRRGQNVRLASQLTGWHIDITTEEEDSERRAKDFERQTNLFIENLDVDETLAQLLVVEGFYSLEDLAMCEASDIGDIEGLDEDIAAELIIRAQKALDNMDDKLREECVVKGVEESLVYLELLPAKVVAALAKAGVTKLEDFADLSSDEVIEMIGDVPMTREELDSAIMKARENWFD
ncbi:MAG: transcription termination/antitermination protein NusA [Candidatus Puniceispirillum sp.]|nr:transcription termination/antitermination protein NusA [Candidatus Pelagibacter sp.]MBA4282971.1 transcription termination/antitermination protein NusA [Candidatus Puniceispirillum sp.]